MALEFRDEHAMMRVDGDVLEIFRVMSDSVRIPLPWLAVSVEPTIKGRLMVRIHSTLEDVPLYGSIQRGKGLRGRLDEVPIPIEQEPLYRQFFTQVAQLCGRSVAP